MASLSCAANEEGEDEVAEGVARPGAAEGGDDLDAVLHGEPGRLVHLADHALHVLGSPGAAQQGDAVEEAGELLSRRLGEPEPLDDDREVLSIAHAPDDELPDQAVVGAPEV